MNRTSSITESPNFLSADIDLASPDAIVRILRQTDAQIFAGYLGYPGLYDAQTINSLVTLSERASKTICASRGRVVLAGAGTSGRLAMFAARVFNRILGRDVFSYLIAGGDAALIQSQEGAEDDPHQAVEDLRAAIQHADEVFYVGITCGLSAPYIAGQLEEMLTHERGYSVLMGFNPVKLARSTPIEGWQYTFRDTAERVARADSACVLNPIIGPEPITGSTRMKSGSTTKILLEVLFHTAIWMAEKKRTTAAATKAVIDMLRAYDYAHRSVYLQADSIAKLVSLGGSALRAHRHIYYFGPADLHAGSGKHANANAGIIGLIDASECPPTYGADFEDVRGFLAGGWSALLPGKAPDLSHLGPHFRIGIEDFLDSKLPSLSADDLCVFIGTFPESEDLIRDVRAKGAKTACIVWEDHRRDKSDVRIQLDPEPHRILGYGPLELQMKLVANALTTGAHVLAGKVFGNRMVDLRISNNKLFHRTVGIICDLMKESPEHATEALLRSIYQTDILTDAQRNASIREYIDAARTVEKVVPKALLIATGKFTYGSAARALRSNPIVRAAIEQYIK